MIARMMRTRRAGTTSISPDDHGAGIPSGTTRHVTDDLRSFSPFAKLVLLAGAAFLTAGCQPDESPFKGENAKLRKQAAEQETAIVRMQKENAGMQQQIDHMTKELKGARTAMERAEAEQRMLAAMLDSQVGENKKLAAEVQRMAEKKAQISQSLRVEDKGGQSEDLPRPLETVCKAAEEALARNGYAVKVRIKTDLKAVYVTERKNSPAASIELSGFRNQFLLSLQPLPSNTTRLTVKADFEKIAQGGSILAAGPDETAEIEQRLIAEISKSLATGKV